MKREMSEEGNGMEIIDREMAPFFPAIMPVLVYCVSLPSTSLSMLASSLIIDCNQQEIGHVEKRGKTQ